MTSKAAGSPPIPSPDGGFRPWTCPERREASRAGVLIVGCLAVLLLSSFLAAAGTFPVVQEQVLLGATNGIAGIQAEDGLRETLTEVDTASNFTTTPSAQTLTAGSQLAGSFPTDVAAADGTYVHYREAIAGPEQASGNPGVTLAGCSWTNCDSGRLPDNLSATSGAGGDTVTYGVFGFSVPSSALITEVALGFEAFDVSGNDHLSMEISFDGQTTWCPSFETAGLPAVDPNAYTFVNMTSCSGHAWSPSDFGALLATRFVHVVVGAADTVRLNANIVRVTYQIPSYQMSVRYDWSGTPSGEAYILDVTGHTSSENISVQVLTPPSTWTTRLSIANTTDDTLAYVLAPSEFASGNVSVRFVGALGGAPAPSDLFIDLAQIVSVEYAYTLDVVQNVTGITGQDSILTVMGNISSGAENFDVFVWDFSANNWTLGLGAPFSATNAIHTLPLTSAEQSNGTVRIEYRDRDPASVVPGTLTLDLVRVDTTTPDVPPPFPWALFFGLMVAGSFLLTLFALLILLPRRREAAAAEAVAAGLEPAAIDLEAVEPGHAYLVAEDEPDAAIRVLGGLTRMGRSGLVITPQPAPGNESVAQARHTKVVVLGGEGAPGNLATDADRDAVLSTIEAFLGKNPVGVVLLDGIGGLAVPEKLPALVEIVQWTAEKVSLGEQILLVSAPPESLEGEDGEHLLELLEYVSVSMARSAPPP